MSYGSNVQPRNFGRGGNEPKDWTCICKNANRKWHKKCQFCGIDQVLAERAKKKK